MHKSGSAFLLSAAALAVAISTGPAAGAGAARPYSVEVSDVSAKVGEHATIHATLRPRDGCRVLEAYNNRVSRFSSFDEGVAFERGMVEGVVQDGTLVFTVDVVPTKPGKHAINGVFRVGYIEGTDEMSMISVPLIANVIGTE